MSVELWRGIAVYRPGGVMLEGRRDELAGRLRCMDVADTLRRGFPVTTDAPWHRVLAKEVDFSALPMRPSNQDIELHLQKKKYEKEITTRTQVTALLNSENPDELGEKISQLIESISDNSKNDLIHYVSMRKCVLDLFSKSLEIGADGKRKSEGEVHDIIMPRKKDSEELNYDAHNLWILDERLNFTSYVSSDKPLQSSGDRTDITVYNRRVAYRGDNEASNPITIFEFKKPQRDDFADPSSKEDPIQQIVRYVNQIREGKFKTPTNRDILVNDTTPFYGYVVCDLTKKVKDWLQKEKNFTPMPDGLGWFNWFGNISLYMEVISWTKLLRDAETVQELLRHANSRITLEVYTQAVTSNKRAAQSKVVRMMIPGVGQKAGETDPQKAQVGA